MADISKILDQPRMLAGLDLIGRCGADSFQIRFSDDEEPCVWFAVAIFGSKGKAEAAASLNPVMAILRLCEELVDGSRCTHCNRPAGLDLDSLDTMPMNDLICWYQYDPELKTFRRGCEGN